MYCYQLGVARFLERRVLQSLGAERSAFSGSSAGALVAAVLAANVDIEEIARGVISSRQECRWKPWRMLDKVAWAVRRHIPGGSHRAVSGRLRILLTRVQLAWPPLKPLVVHGFSSTPQLREVLCASCHIPLLGGLQPRTVSVMPMHCDGDGDGTGTGTGENAPTSSTTSAPTLITAACFDGSVWPSVLCPWRTFSASDDVLLTVSGLCSFGGLLADFGPPLPVPLHWVVLPPSEATLWRLSRAGYDDAARRFGSEGGGDLSSFVAEGGARGRASRARNRRPVTCDGGALMVAHRHDLVLPILIGWLQLLFFLASSIATCACVWSHVLHV
jgi:hypothetical protein